MKRHDWRPGIEQHCGNLRCNWIRMRRIEIDPAHPRGFVYKRAQGYWEVFPKVPKCGAKR